MASVEEILRRASRLTGLRYDGAADTGSEAEILRQALEDVYIDVLLETQIVERIYVHSFNANNSGGDLSLETYNEYSNFARVEDESKTFPVGDTVTLFGPMNPSGVVEVTDNPATLVYAENVDYTVDRDTSSPTFGVITRLPGGSIPALANVLVSYFKQAPTLTIDDDIRLPPFLKIRHVVHNQSGGSSHPLQMISTTELLEYRRGFGSAGFSRVYSLSGDGIMRVWPDASNNDSLEITYVPLPPRLDEIDNRPAGMWDSAIWDLSNWDDFRGVESTPSLIPIQFHWNTLLPGVVVQALDKDQRSADVQFWQSRYDAGLAKIHLWAATYGNVEGGTVFNSINQQFGKWPSQYIRGGF